MLLAFALGASGVTTIFIALAALSVMVSLSVEKVFPEARPRWLMIVTWLYLTWAILGWIGFSRHITPMALLAAGMATLAAGKFLFVFLSYPDFMPIGRVLWRNRGALSVIMISSVLVGGLMIFVTQLL
ncbi:MAG TPA: hypothetical protein PLY88_02350 [Candidatus Omnitrophota bacterium]|nr:hypothetical protein [Candidatus Omnitrophota bacterium]